MTDTHSHVSTSLPKHCLTTNGHLRKDLLIPAHDNLRFSRTLDEAAQHQIIFKQTGSQAITRERMSVSWNSINISSSGGASIELQSASQANITEEGGENDVLSAMANVETVSAKRSVSNEEASPQEHKSEIQITKRPKKNGFMNWFSL